MRVEFGTDGIRGVANAELTPDVALAAGRCIAYVMSVARRGAAGRIMIAKDTRISGDMVEGALVAGICSVGVNVWKLGIAPTPCLAYLTKAARCDAGVMISASHNPIEDNGIKVFDRSGYKLDDAMERTIERLMNGAVRKKLPAPTGERVGLVIDRSRAASRYTSAVSRIMGGVRIEGRVVIDCANGATARFAKRVFRDHIEDAVIMNGDEDGRRINVDCGSTMPGKMARRVVRTGARLGFAFDGDGDRVIFADEKGNTVDGDNVMLLCAGDFKRRGRLKGNVVVATVMSNLGLEVGLGRIGARMIRTPVGDKYVLREMLRGGYSIGGEQSGHVIFFRHSTTGDGLITAAQVLRIFGEAGGLFSELAKMRRSEQLLRNVTVKDRKNFSGNRKIGNAIRRAAKELEGRGRVVVRPSGTEPKIRVMVEAWDAELAARVADDIIGAVRDELGEA
ncbi:MAG: phosphoglucosamine mutase [bacterium]